MRAGVLVAEELSAYPTQAVNTSLAGGVLSCPHGQTQAQVALCGTCEVTKLPAGLCLLLQKQQCF